MTAYTTLSGEFNLNDGLNCDLWDCFDSHD